MPGKLVRNLRRGHRAEGLGVELLRAFCAVAQVPQTEDVGFDAVATVLRVDDRFLVAEHSFCVQFKARSVRDLAYDHSAYEWLRALPLPLFIGSVDAQAQEVAVYTTHNVACRVDSEHYDSVVLRLDPPSRTDGKVLHEYLGDPIVRWTYADSESDAFHSQACAVLSAWVALEQLHQPLRRIKTTQMLRWQTNQIPDAQGTMLAGHPDDLRRDIEAAAPYILKVGSHFLSQQAASAEALAFILLAKWLAENGADHFKYIAKLLASQMTSKAKIAGPQEPAQD
jgi:hypothetical protein